MVRLKSLIFGTRTSPQTDIIGVQRYEQKEDLFKFIMQIKKNNMSIFYPNIFVPGSPIVAGNSNLDLAKLL